VAILGIETSTAVCSVGLIEDDGSVKERALVESRIHSEKLLTLIDEVCGGSLRSLRGIAISIGPGSFTGLRIGLSTAKGLCFGLGIPLAAVPTFRAITMCAVRKKGCSSLLICLDAKQGEYYASSWRRDGEGKEEEKPVQILAMPEVLRLIAEPGLILTDCLKAVQKADPAIQGEDVLPFCSGAMIAEIGKEMLDDNQQADAASCEPMYLKDFIVRTQVKA
jgi:tRNA threonylcarbamoyladenosine biosynthesis protein TsaB